MERSRSYIFYTPSSSINLLNQRKIVLARNIGHASDTSLNVYLLDPPWSFISSLNLCFQCFFNTALPEHRALAIHTGNIVVASYSIDTLNVIYCSHTPILLDCLLQICSRISLYIVNQQECFKKIIMIFLQKSSTEIKIATIFYVNATRICKTQISLFNTDGMARNQPISFVNTSAMWTVVFLDTSATCT